MKKYKSRQKVIWVRKMDNISVFSHTFGDYGIIKSRMTNLGFLRRTKPEHRLKKYFCKKRIIWERGVSWDIE